MTMVTTVIRPLSGRDENALVSFLRDLGHDTPRLTVERWQDEIKLFQRIPVIIRFDDHGQLTGWALVHLNTDVAPSNRRSMFPSTGLAYVRQLKLQGKGDTSRLVKTLISLIDKLLEYQQLELVMDLPRALGELTVIRQRLHNLAGNDSCRGVVRVGDQFFDRYYVPAMSAKMSLVQAFGMI